MEVPLKEEPSTSQDGEIPNGDCCDELFEIEEYKIENPAGRVLKDFDYSGSNDSGDNIDTELLISQVETRKMLWDRTSKEFSNRDIKRNAWKEIFKILAPNYEEMSVDKQNTFGNQVEKRWRNVRDAFTKSLKENKFKSGLRWKRKKYIYHNELQFLQTNPTPKEMVNSIVVTRRRNEGLVRGDFPTQERVRRKEGGCHADGGKQKEKKKQKLRTVEEKLLDYLDSQANTCHGSQDDHEQFFNSLLPSVRKFDEDETLQFRSEVLTLIRGIKKAKYFIDCPSVPPGSYRRTSVGQSFLSPSCSSAPSSPASSNSSALHSFS